MKSIIDKIGKIILTTDEIFMHYSKNEDGKSAPALSESLLGVDLRESKVKDCILLFGKEFCAPGLSCSICSYLPALSGKCCLQGFIKTNESSGLKILNSGKCIKKRK